MKTYVFKITKRREEDDIDIEKIKKFDNVGLILLNYLSFNNRKTSILCMEDTLSKLRNTQIWTN